MVELEVILVSFMKKLTGWQSFRWNKHTSVFDSLTFKPESLSLLVMASKIFFHVTD
jgi:hypothetical protein